MARPRGIVRRFSFYKISCERTDKLQPAIRHVVKESFCRPTSIDCSPFGGGHLTVYVQCPSESMFDGVRQAIKREIELLKHHRIAGKKKR